MICWDTIFSGITAAAPLAIAFASWFALNSWKKERRYDLAEDIVLLSHEVEDRLGVVRFQQIMSDDFISKGNKFTDVEERLQIFAKRLNDNFEPFNRLYSLKLKADLRFKKEGVNTKLEELINIIVNVRRSAGILANGIAAGVDISRDDTLKECIRNIIAYEKDDKIANKVNSIVKGVEQALLPYYTQ